MTLIDSLYDEKKSMFDEYFFLDRFNPITLIPIIKYDYYVDGILDDSSGTLIFKKASLDLGELEVCNFEVLNKKMTLNQIRKD